MAPCDRRRNSPTYSPPNSHPSADAVPAAGYDWTKFGRHAFRLVDEIIIDFPLNALAPAAPWIATLWSDPASPVGWARNLWLVDEDHRGWKIPPLACGDIVEFGADPSAAAAGPEVRWYGLVDAYDAISWLTLQGPYPTPAAAWEHAQQLLAAHRYQPPTRSPSTAPPRRQHHRP